MFFRALWLESNQIRCTAHSQTWMLWMWMYQHTCLRFEYLHTYPNFTRETPYQRRLSVETLDSTLLLIILNYSSIRVKESNEPALRIYCLVFEMERGSTVTTLTPPSFLVIYERPASLVRRLQFHIQNSGPNRLRKLQSCDETSAWLVFGECNGKCFV